MVGTGSERVTWMEVKKQEERGEDTQGTQAQASAVIPAVGARKARTVAGVKLKAVSSEMILPNHPWKSNLKQLVY